MSDLLVFKAVPYAKLLAAVPGIEHWKAQARRGNRLIKKVFFFFRTLRTTARPSWIFSQSKERGGFFGFSKTCLV